MTECARDIVAVDILIEYVKRQLQYFDFSGRAPITFNAQARRFPLRLLDTAFVSGCWSGFGICSISVINEILTKGGPCDRIMT